MGKSIKCTVICNTRNGYCLHPKECTSITEAIRHARSLGMAYRIFIDGKFFKRGSFN